MKNVLYVVNDCMRLFTWERTAGLCRAIRKMDEAVNLYVFRSSGYFKFGPAHNRGEYNIYRLPEYREFDGILLDINSIFSASSDPDGDRMAQYVMEAAAASGKPVISMAREIEGFRYAGIDNYAAMASVIRCLHGEMGLRDFWFIVGPRDNYESDARTRALTEYCEQHHLDCGRLYAEDFTYGCGERGFERLYASSGGRLPQAILCANDLIAMGVCRAAEANGVRIPDDVFVTGFDNTDFSAYRSPSLTTVDQQGWKMGEACMEALARLWRGEEVPEHIWIPTQLKLRETTGHAAPSVEEMALHGQEFVQKSTSLGDFNYRLHAMQYRLPGCRTLEEICETLRECITVTHVDALELILDMRLFEHGRLIAFRDDPSLLQDPSAGMPEEGYSGNMERVFHWEAGQEPCWNREKVGRSFSPAKGERGGRNTLVVPLHFMEHTIGYLTIRNCTDAMRIDAVSTVVSSLTMALKNFFVTRNLSYMNQILSGLSRKDELTGMYNRLGYHDLVYPMYRKLARRNERLGILFLDMDRLKHINDTYGHARGDDAIRSVSRAILRCIPEDAIPVRYGGDEFIVFLPGGDAARAGEILNRVAGAIPEEARALDAPEEIAFSAGVVMTDPEDSRTLEEYVEEADARMYEEKKAKNPGR